MDLAIDKTKKNVREKCVPAVWKDITRTDYVLNLVTLGGLSLLRQQEYWADARAYQACVDKEFKDLVAKYHKN